jgi:hypothetical protein
MAAAGVGVVEVVEVVESVFTFPNPINRAPGTIAGSTIDVVGDDVDVKVDEVVGVDVIVGVVMTMRFSEGDGPGRSTP